MSIRKRYDEAQDLIARELYEPALILLLVAVAAASERYRKHQTGGASKGRGDDRKWFTIYVDSGLPPPVQLLRGDSSTRLSEILYKDLRCELIHEAALRDEDAFSDDPYFVAFDMRANRVTFGIDLLFALSDLLKADPLGREEFRDLLSEFDNLVEYDSESKGHGLREISSPGII